MFKCVDSIQIYCSYFVTLFSMEGIKLFYGGGLRYSNHLFGHSPWKLNVGTCKIKESF